MAVNVSLNGVTYSIPNAAGESGWATTLSTYLQVLPTSFLAKTGGSFTLTADADFGATYGLKSNYFSSRTTPASAGFLRIGNDTLIAWRDAGNSADITLKVNASDVFQFTGGTLQLDALTATTVPYLDASKQLVSSAVTPTELGYVSGVTSAIQTQIDSKAASSHTHDTADIVSGTFADARVAESNVTQHEAALTITESQVSDIGAYIENVSEDLTPQLGGSLDVNGNSIVSTANGNITITPNGTGSIVLDGLNWPQADGTAGFVLQTDGFGQLSWVAAGAGNVIGPASSTDNAITRFDSTTGKLIQNSTVTIDDSGNIAGVGNLNGKDADSLVEGAVSSTDNAIARFDGTTGELIQNSGITINDSNNISGVASINFGGDSLNTYTAPAVIVPVVNYGGVSATNSVTSNASRYSQIGKIVTIVLSFAHQRDASDSGDLTLDLSATGIPSALTTTVGSAILGRLTFPSGRSDLVAQISGTTISFLLAGSAVNTSVSSTDMSTTAGTFKVTITYFTA